MISALFDVIIFAALALIVWEFATLNRKINKLKQDNATLWEWVDHFGTIIEPEEKDPPT